MAKKSSGTNKSQAIREYYAAHPGAKPKQVVEALAAQGVQVSPAFVSTIRSTSVTKGRKRGPKPGTKRGPRPTKTTRRAVGRPKTRATSATRGASGTVSIDSLVKAKGLVKELGGIDNAMNTLAALKQLAD
jgi:hypothetical protein